MDVIELANLRRKRLYIHKQLDRYEPLIARLKTALIEAETAIQAVAPDLNIPPRRYQPNPYFARGELPRIVLAMLREASEPLSVREIALRALAMKNVPLPDRRAMKRTRLRVQQAMARFGARGIVRTVGEGRVAKRTLVCSDNPLG